MYIPGLDFRSHRRRLLDRSLEKVRNHFTGRVLDVGGGRERGTFEPPPATEWITLDINADFQPMVVGDASQLPIASDEIDAVKCTEVLEHVPRPEQLISEINRVLSPGGALVLSMPFNYGIHGDPHDYQRFTASQLRRLLEGEFEIKCIEAQGAYFTVLAYMIQRAIVTARTPLKRLFYPLLPVTDALAALDRLPTVKKSDYYQSFTTGYFVLAINLETEGEHN